jgi:hypothetical protein
VLITKCYSSDQIRAYVIGEGSKKRVHILAKCVDTTKICFKKLVCVCVCVCV